MKYQVRAVSADNVLSDLVIEATNEDDARQQVSQRGLFVASVSLQGQLLGQALTRRFGGAADLPLVLFSQELLALVEAERSTIAELPASRTATSLDRVLGQGRRLQQLIADLLLLANLERPFPQSQKQVCNLAEISADVLEECGEAAAAAQVSLEQKRWMSPARVLGNEAELGRLLINLVSNAIQHSPIGGRIEVSLEQRGREIKLSIHDSGPGIPAAQRQHIFDRFTRLDPGRSRSQGGTGLGLAIAQAIARRHGGGISVQCNPVQSNPVQFNPVQSNPVQSNPVQSNPVQCNPGAGSCFCVTLPSAD